MGERPGAPTAPELVLETDTGTPPPVATVKTLSDQNKALHASRS
jgi:hypothetical protein